MSAYFSITSNTQQQYTFYLFDNDSSLVLISENYDDQAATEKAISELKGNSLNAHFIARHEGDDGEIFFTIKNPASKLIVQSALYTSQSAMNNAIQYLSENMSTAAIKHYDATPPLAFSYG